MARLLLISNRGPVSFSTREGGALVARRGGGGLVTALDGLAGQHDVTWVAHAMGDGDLLATAEAEEQGGSLVETSRGGDPYRLRFSGAPDRHYREYYNTISNPLLWFVHHRLYGFGWDPSITRRTHQAWDSYRRVNHRMAESALEEMGTMDEAPITMVHDYQLMLVPGVLRAHRPDVPLHFFLHIPWPGQGAWKCLPREWVEEILQSLLAADIVGFQTARNARHFAQTCTSLLNAESADTGDGVIEVRHAGRTTRLRSYPISLSVPEFEELSRSKTVGRLRQRIESMRPGDDGQLIVRVDRTDPSKNIVRGFHAFRLMLHEHPELHERVTMFCQLDPSRQDVEEYARYMRQIQVAADEVNIEFATAAWQPLYLNLDSNFAAAVAAYGSYDVLFVNPVADGMNLVSKEGPIVNDRHGVVVLSEQAGSFHELGDEVIAVNPFDEAAQADALYTALTMDADDRRRRAETIRQQVIDHDVHRWINDQLADMQAVAGANHP